MKCSWTDPSFLQIPLESSRTTDEKGVLSIKDKLRSSTTRPEPWIHQRDGELNGSTGGIIRGSYRTRPLKTNLPGATLDG
jgi:hypothetical protein